MILFSSEALSDIDRRRHFLEVRNPAAAVRAMRAIWHALERVEDFPDIGPEIAAFASFRFNSAAAAKLFAIESYQRTVPSSSYASVTAASGGSEQLVAHDPFLSASATVTGRLRQSLGNIRFRFATFGASS